MWSRSWRPEIPVPTQRQREDWAPHCANGATEGSLPVPPGEQEPGPASIRRGGPLPSTGLPAALGDGDLRQEHQQGCSEQ